MWSPSLTADVLLTQVLLAIQVFRGYQLGHTALLGHTPLALLLSSSADQLKENHWNLAQCQRLTDSAQ